MYHQVIFFFLLHSAAVFCPFGDVATNHGEFAKVDSYVEFIPASAIFILNDVSDILSVIRCCTQCVFNPLCLTATLYEDLRLCRLFSADISQGTITGKSNSKVISLIDRVLSGISYPAGNMISARDFHKSVFIPATETVQIVGGSDGFSDLSSTEVFVARNGSFVQQGSTLAIRRFHTVDYLNDRTVLIAGGWHSIWTAELYDPLTGVSNRSIPLNTPRAEHASAVINESLNGTMKLLLVGGMDVRGKLASGDVFDTKTGVFTLVDNNMTSSRSYHTATTIDNGHVLLAGGINNDTVKLDSLDLYNSSSNLFSPISARMSTARAYHTATYIPSIQAVLFVGGRSQTQTLRTYDLFNVSTFTFSILNGSTVNARAYHTATLLLDEQVLVVGGQNSVRLSSCELYNSVTNSFESVSDMSTDRADHTSTLLSHTGHVLTCGGQNENGVVLSSCELYRP